MGTGVRVWNRGQRKAGINTKNEGNQEETIYVPMASHRHTPSNTRPFTIQKLTNFKKHFKMQLLPSKLFAWKKTRWVSQKMAAAWV